MGEKCKEQVCDLLLEGIALSMPGFDDPRTNWDSEGCGNFNPKHKQTISKNMPHYCLKVCGNCEYFTVALYEHVSGSSSEGGVIERVG